MTRALVAHGRTLSFQELYHERKARSSWRSNAASPDMMGSTADSNFDQERLGS